MLRARLETLISQSEYVLPDMAYRYVHNAGHISQRIEKLFVQCGIKTKLEIPNKANTKRHNKSVLSFHSLRFTMGHLLISSGFSLDTIAQVLGHSSTTMSRHYSNVTDAVKERAILSMPTITAQVAQA